MEIAVALVRWDMMRKGGRERYWGKKRKTISVRQMFSTKKIIYNLIGWHSDFGKVSAGRASGRSQWPSGFVNHPVVWATSSWLESATALMEGLPHLAPGKWSSRPKYWGQLLRKAAPTHPDPEAPFHTLRNGKGTLKWSSISYRHGLGSHERLFTASYCSGSC